jgi:hypothetical protein
MPTFNISTEQCNDLHAALQGLDLLRRSGGDVKVWLDSNNSQSVTTMLFKLRDALQVGSMISGFDPVTANGLLQRIAASNSFEKFEDSGETVFLERLESQGFIERRKDSRQAGAFMLTATGEALRRLLSLWLVPALSCVSRRLARI